MKCPKGSGSTSRSKIFINIYCHISWDFYILMWLTKLKEILMYLVAKVYLDSKFWGNILILKLVLTHAWWKLSSCSFFDSNAGFLVLMTKDFLKYLVFEKNFLYCCNFLSQNVKSHQHHQIFVNVIARRLCNEDLHTSFKIEYSNISYQCLLNKR